MKAQLLTFQKIVALCFLIPLYIMGESAFAHMGANTIPQSIIVTGRITAANDNESLPGVNILIKGTSIGTVTDVDGRYTIEVPNRESVLVISSIGFETEELTVGDRNSIDLKLTPSITALQEVVVVGYGTQEKVSVTSSVGQVESAELMRRPVTTLQQAMQGTVPGLTILDQGGSPGSPNQQIVIRGVNTIYNAPGQVNIGVSDIGNNQPLVIVDGIEQPLQNLNPADIESISVLKDASSSAIYGSRANNGVILVTTKRAKDGKVSVSYSGFYALQQAISKPEHMDIDSYLELEQAAYANVGSVPPASLPQYSVAGRPIYVAGTKSNRLKYPLPFDWYNQLYRTAPQTNHTIAVSGGTDAARARLSVRHQDQDGIIANTNSKLTDVRLNSDLKVSPKISASADLNYRFTNTVEPYNINEIFRQLMQNSIWAVPKYPNGDYGGGTQGNNPLLLAEKGGTNRLLSNYITGSVTGNWEIIKGLKFTTQVAFRTNDSQRKNFSTTWETRDSTTLKKSNAINRLVESRDNMREITLNSLLNYSVDIQNHGIKVLAGYSQIANEFSTLNATRQGFYNNDVTSINGGLNDATKDNGGFDSQWGLRSYFGRVNYSFKDKYFLEANGRYDGSSRFTGNNQYSFFPSFSAGWRISEESFWTPVANYVSQLKLRGSWGQTGNNMNVGLYNFYARIDPVTYSFNNTIVQGFEQRQIADPTITWETGTQTDIGLDAEILNGKFSLTVDYYKKINRDILLQLPVPGALGLLPGTQNVGVVQNQGWEFTVGSNHMFGGLSLRTNLNFAANNNKVLDMGGSGPIITGNDIDPRFIIDEGYPMNAFWGYKTDGLFQNDADAAAYPQFMRVARAGDVKVLDRNNDGAITPADMTYLGNSVPKYTYGGTIQLGFKGFSLNLTLQGAGDFGMRIARALGEQGNYEGFTPDIYTNNYWTPERPNARFPRPVKQDLRNQASTDRMIVDATYFRVKNIQLAYQLPSAFTRKVSIERASVFISGTNLITFSKLNEWHLDPESTSGWQNYYPQTSLYTLGVNLQL